MITASRAKALAQTWVENRVYGLLCTLNGVIEERATTGEQGISIHFKEYPDLYDSRILKAVKTELTKPDENGECMVWTDQNEFVDLTWGDEPWVKTVEDNTDLENLEDMPPDEELTLEGMETIEGPLELETEELDADFNSFLKGMK